MRSVIEGVTGAVACAAPGVVRGAGACAVPGAAAGAVPCAVPSICMLIVSGQVFISRGHSKIR